MQVNALLIMLLFKLPDCISSLIFCAAAPILAVSSSKLLISSAYIPNPSSCPINKNLKLLDRVIWLANELDRSFQSNDWDKLRLTSPLHIDQSDTVLHHDDKTYLLLKRKVFRQFWQFMLNEIQVRCTINSTGKNCRSY